MFYQYRTEKPHRWAVEEIAPQAYKGLAGTPLLDGPKDEPAAEPSPGPSAASPSPKAAAPERVSSEGLARNPFARGKVIIFFPYNSNELTPEGLAVLDRIAEFLKANPSLKAEIRGYTDSVGAINYNVSVSAFRANSIKSYLTGKGVSASNLVALGLGPKNPIASNDTLEGREQNRRVEIEPAM